ncbi:MAG: tyrosine-type recombinase/integrase [Bryobacterales bacterium]|nr:tyrosine-type recombinase/integrase [Bryobacterales bacterium]
MFEHLYKDPATIAKYQRAPLLEDRERYLRSAIASGTVGDVVRRVARTQLVLVDLLNLPDAGIPIRLATVERAVQGWCRNVSAVSAANFRRHAFRWLRFLGWLDEPLDAHPHARQVAAFAAWMRNDRGLSEATVSNCCNESDRLFAWAARRNLILADITISDVDAYLAERIAAGGLRRNSARTAAGCLRSFFRFAETRNWCRPGISGCILPPLAYPDRPVPKGFDRDEVEKLLATTEGSTPADCRDRAVLMILATCGLRSGEVGALRVEDIDWERDLLRVFRPKTGRTDTFPLTPSIGNALMDYLLKVRPDAGRERALFLTLQAPFRPLHSGAIGMIVRSRANRLGITGKRLGAHALRHAAAQRLVDEGCGLKTVGDFLGHASPRATAAYATIDLASLRPVAEVGLKELLDDAA